jgi:uncharacterized membrane protein YesL
MKEYRLFCKDKPAADKEELLVEMRGLMGGFYRISEWIMRLSAINILWVVCSIPFFFLLLSTMITPDATQDQLLSMMWMLAIVAPFTLIPATSAMFAVARKWVMGDDDVPLFKTYFRSYKDNYKQSMLGGLIFVVFGAILIVNLDFYSDRTDGLRWLSILFLSFSVVFFAAFINFMSLTVHFHMKLFQLVKNAFIMTLGQPVTSVAILVTNGFIIYISGQYTFLIPFFMGSLCAITSFWYFYRSFQRIQDKADKQREKEAERQLNNGDDSVQTKD